MGIAVVLGALVGVRYWRVRVERAALEQQLKDAERQLEQLKREYERAQAEEAQLKERLEQARQSADQAREPKKGQRSPAYFDHPGWRNDTGEPRPDRLRPLPVDPSLRTPEERDRMP